MTFRLRQCVTALAAVLVAAVVQAQVPAGNDFRVNAYTTSSQIYVRMAPRPDGGFVVVWTDGGRTEELGWGVFGQRHDARGALIGSEFKANTYTTGNQGLYFVSVAADGTGDFVVVWNSDGQDGSGSGVFGQRFDPEGRRLGAEFQVNGDTTGDQGRFGVSVAAAHGGDFVVVWQSQPPLESGISGQRFDSGGNRVGMEFVIAQSTTSAQSQPVVAMDRAGRFVVAWVQSNPASAVLARRYDTTGVPQGGPFQVNTYTSANHAEPSVASDPAGAFVVAWNSSTQDGDGTGIFAQRFDASGNKLGGEFQVNTVTTDSQNHPAVAADSTGRFTIAWETPDDSFFGIGARSFDADGAPRGPEFRVNTYTTGGQVEPAIAADAAGNFVVAWPGRGPAEAVDLFARRYGGLLPAALSVDTNGTGQSDGNGVWEPGETANVRPSWRNVTGAAQAIAGLATSLVGPSGATYNLTDATGNYGTIANATTSACNECYAVAVSSPPVRPASHWDASVLESLLPAAQGQRLRWSLHIGDSFGDVPRSSGFYRFIETLLHREVTAGCTGTTYCPAASTSREQMSVFVLVSKEGAGYRPPACTTPLFADVPSASPFCRFIEELARRGVVSGCGGGNYCPQAAVSREQMAVFVLLTLDPALNPPACTAPVFNDVPASSPFCRWIEELARRGVVSGCGSGNYCPAGPVTRDQMAVFLGATFGLTLYGP